MTTKIKFINLFAGTGAFSYVLEKTRKYECVFSNDMITSSKSIYDLNHKTKLTLQDLNTVDVKTIPKHNLLCGGCPCQPFSIAGKQEGFNDARTNVFWKIIEILKHHKPETIILENVKKLLTHDKGKTFRIIKKELEDIGYHIKFEKLDTSKITKIPQHRERIYIVGFLKKDHFNNFNFNSHNQEIKENTIKSLLETNINDKYYYTEEKYESVYEKIKDVITQNISTNKIYQYRSHKVRENKTGRCHTLTANMGTRSHYVPLIKDDNGIRKLTPRECFNLQGFPKNYKLPELSDGKLYSLAGNAVSVPVVELIVKKLLLLSFKSQDKIIDLKMLEKENEYLLARKKILMNNQNKGEKDEILLQLELYHLNEMNKFNKLIDIFGEEASKGINILNIATNAEITDINKLSKAPSGYKADCKIRMKKTNNIYSISIKSKNGANPSLLNHTPRSAKIFQEGGIFNDHVSCLDQIIQEYIDKRKNKKIGEDTTISTLSCLKDDNLLKEKFKEILSYFAFDGTGRGLSKCGANAMIEYHNDKITFINCDNIDRKKEYIESIFHKIYISLRNKSMPKVMNEYCKPWIYDDIKPDGSIKHKGSLHIRIK